MSVPAARVTVRVAVQSPRRLLRDTLAVCLAVRPEITVIGNVAEPDDIFALCELRHPDVVILDAGVRLGEMAARAHTLLRHFPELNVIVTYREATERELAAACRAGVASLLPESHGLAAVLALVKRSKGRHARQAEGGLTDRELEIIVLTGSGHSVPEIAALLRISPLTVENTKRRVYAKLDVSSSVGAVAPGPAGGGARRPGPAGLARRRRARHSRGTRAQQPARSAGAGRGAGQRRERPGGGGPGGRAFPVRAPDGRPGVPGRRLDAHAAADRGGPRSLGRTSIRQG